MGKIVLSALVGIWMFNLARLVAGGISGHAQPPEAALYASPAETAAGPAQQIVPGEAIHAPLAIRDARLTHAAPAEVSVSLVLAAAAEVEVLLLDSTERTLARHVQHLPAGAGGIRLHAHERLAPGRYWIRARAGDRVVTTAVVIGG